MAETEALGGATPGRLPWGQGSRVGAGETAGIAYTVSPCGQGLDVAGGARPPCRAGRMSGGAGTGLLPLGVGMGAAVRFERSFFVCFSAFRPIAQTHRGSIQHS
jgi:hypothetical protein